MRGENLCRTAFYLLAGHIDILKRTMIFCISEILHTPTIGKISSETSGELQNGAFPPGSGQIPS